MKNSEYYISINKIKIAKTSNLDFFNLNKLGFDDFEIILIKSNKITLLNDIKITKKEVITLSHYINDICISQFDASIIENEYAFQDNTPLSLTIKTDDELSLNTSTIIKEWFNGNEILYWKNNNSNEAKNLWLTTCLYWQQIFQPSIKSELNVYLNLEKVNNRLDFFCMLGEAFWGRKGYMGRDFYGLDDLLSELRSIKINIYIKNEKKMKQFLENISPQDNNYYLTFIDILSKNNCNIIVG